MRILIIGSGGREHALAWKVAQSPHCENLYIAPGNPGAARVGSNADLDIADHEAVGDFVRDHSVELIVVGPEAPLAAGLADYIRQRDDTGITRILGPGREAAQLESSKAYAKIFMEENGIPTAPYRTFTRHEHEAARQYLGEQDLPVVIKADGLAAGKGVTVAHTREEAYQALEECLGEGKFGEAGEQVVIEGFLEGRELSVFVLTDGREYLLLPSATDYKCLEEGGKGPNTGGMGTLSPAPLWSDSLEEKVRRQIIEPTLKGLSQRNLEYRGFLFFGLMMVGDDPFVIEYNVRLGDPETQSMLPRINEDLLPQLDQAAQGQLKTDQLNIAPQKAATVVLASEGYPGRYAKGLPIFGLQPESSHPLEFHAGTAQDGERIVTSGGRVLGVTALGDGYQQALDNAYAHIQKLHFDGMYYRKDIGQPFINEPHAT